MKNDNDSGFRKGKAYDFTVEQQKQYVFELIMSIEDELKLSEYRQQKSYELATKFVVK